MTHDAKLAVRHALPPDEGHHDGDDRARVDLADRRVEAHVRVELGRPLREDALEAGYRIIPAD